jgi:putative hemolysin
MRRPPHIPALAYPVTPSSLPRRQLNHPPYLVTFARSAADLDAVLRLRFDVFNLELHEGFAESYRTGRDEDPFDDVMHHLMVLKMPEREVIGTYRLQTAAMARENLGFYTGTEFDVSALPAALTDQAMEIGRACVARAYRNRLVLFLLWKGLAAYMLHNQQRYLFGCCSLTSQDPAEGWRAYRHLEAGGHLHPEFRVTPREGYRCGDAASEAAGAVGADDFKLPLLFRTYLRYGAKVCGPPVIDRQFGTIDFFVLMDVQTLAPDVFDEYFQFP